MKHTVFLLLVILIVGNLYAITGNAQENYLVLKLQTEASSKSLHAS